MTLTSKLALITIIVFGLSLFGLRNAYAATCTKPDGCTVCTCTAQYNKMGVYIGISYSNCNSSACVTPPPPTPDTAAACKGSGCFKPTSIPNRTIYTQSQTVNTTPIKDFNYAALPSCPGDPLAYSSTEMSQFSTTQHLTPPRTDILGAAPPVSGSYPANTPKTGTGTNAKFSTPEDQCKVTSRVACTDNTNPTYDNPSCVTSKVISHAVSAVCPDGYVQVGAFNMQPEVIHSSGETYYPISTMNEYEKYSSTAGYACTGIQNGYKENNTCSTGADFKNVWNPWGYTFNNPQMLASQGSVNGKPQGTYVGYLTDSTDYEQCYYASPANCVNFVPGYGGCPAPGNIYNRKYLINRYFYSCSRSAGTYFTANSAPRSLICARIKSEYQKLNK